MTRRTLFTTLALALSTQFLTAQDAPQPVPKPEEKAPPYIDVQIMPIGPQELMIFKHQAPKKKAPADTPNANSTPTEGEGEGETRSAPSHETGLQVVIRPEDERPPTRYYLKTGDHYQVVSCNLNSLGNPVRLKPKTPILDFYEMKRNKEGKEVFKKAFSYKMQPEQKRLLVTVTKPLKTKKWTDPKVNTYNLSKIKLDQSSIFMINAGSERYIGGYLHDEKFALKPYATKVFPSLKENGVKMKLAASPDGRKWANPQDLALPNAKNFTYLFVTYPVTPQEDFRGFKLARSKIKADENCQDAPIYRPQP
ncbi:hypothetical protein SAMN02745181_1681 [Rubritalea squalenifaciens DSM 18772]|uniref:Uncharacterized protein n=1 Tax=Rubritalea squalenifaciens DSM 18772 TaxID=1123071 RepID=A0A1M6I4I0_9BACT|nr:hypothetical protein [Rubritalea squalenifaciens]SHJ29358.1 hypothetical protein SAMN02745181_1681 [Rubritalea squalenifaciens DSM 18772]